jgi:hypothetical protein
MQTPQVCASGITGNSVDDSGANLKGTSIMAKYLLGWILGVPVSSCW